MSWLELVSPETKLEACEWYAAYDPSGVIATDPESPFPVAVEKLLLVA